MNSSPNKANYDYFINSHGNNKIMITTKTKSKDVNEQVQ